MKPTFIKKLAKQGACHSGIHPCRKNNAPVMVGFDMAGKPTLTTHNRGLQGRTKVAASLKTLITAKTTATNPAQTTDLPDHG
jgi:hypothetical protein